jgi:hypothetical protein
VSIQRFSLSISPEARMTVPQRFVINHPDEAAFKTGGLRDYSATATSAWRRRHEAWHMRT